jgi:hypothetical protein
MLAVASSTRKIRGSLLSAPQIYRLIARSRICDKKLRYRATSIAENNAMHCSQNRIHSFSLRPHTISEKHKIDSLTLRKPRIPGFNNGLN